MSDRDRGAEQAPRASDQLVNIGGLMRCCTLTLHETRWHGQTGDRIECRYCSSFMTFADGAWRWGGTRGDGERG